MITYRNFTAISPSLLTATKSAYLLVVLLVVFFAFSATAQVTYTTKKSGDFNDKNTWDVTIAPGSNEYNNGDAKTPDIVKYVIQKGHSVNLNFELELGNQNGKPLKGREMVIENGGTLLGSGKLIIRNNKSTLTNNGTLSLSNFDFGRNGNDSAFFVNTGTATLSGNASFDKGAIINQGNLTFNLNNLVFNKTSVRNAPGKMVTINNGVHLNSGASFTNLGSFIIKSTQDEALNINQGTIRNGGTFEILGGVKVNGGAGSNIYNSGIFRTKKVYMNSSSSLKNWGQFFCTNDFQSSSAYVTNYPCAYLEQSSSGKMFHNWNSYARLINDGFLKINGNLINDDQISGVGSLYVKGIIENRNQATIASTINITSSEPASCSYFITGPVLVEEGQTATYTLPIPSDPTATVTWLVPTGWTILSGQNSYSLKVQAGPGKGQIYMVQNDLFKVTLDVASLVIIAPLPVTLTSFAAVAKENAVALQWATASEKDNKEFVVERSHNGFQFEEITVVAGHGSTFIAQNYSATDVSPLTGTTYYRLKQVDYDGKFEYSNLPS